MKVLTCPHCQCKSVMRVLPPNGGHPWQCINETCDYGKPVTEMHKGEINKTVPLTGQQNRWLVQGSAAKPYVVTQLQYSTVWQCSCKAWTSHVPRTDCKHILLIKTTVAPDLKVMEELKELAKLKKLSETLFPKPKPKLVPNESMTKLVPVPKTITVVVPVHPKLPTNGRKFR